MAAPVGNEFWKLRSESGRKALFSTPESFLQKCFEYFQWCNDNPWVFKQGTKKIGKTTEKGQKVETSQRPYTITGLCVYLGITPSYFSTTENRWQEKQKKGKSGAKDFVNAFAYVRSIIETNQLEGACVGAYNATIISRVLGLADKTDVTTRGGNIIWNEEKTYEVDSKTN